MKLPVEVLIVSASPIYARAVQQLLQLWPDLCDCRILGSAEGGNSRRGAGPDLLLILPENWEEMAGWLPYLQRRFPGCPWLLLAEWRLVGMFLSRLQGQPCAVVASQAPPEELRSALLALVSRHTSPLGAELLMRFTQGAAEDDASAWGRLPSPMELQCACAVSLGLNNRQIAEMMYLGEATVKSHVHHLLQKLGLSSRTELGGCVLRALAPISPPFRWK